MLAPCAVYAMLSDHFIQTKKTPATKGTPAVPAPKAAADPANADPAKADPPKGKSTKSSKSKK